ncbi:hypothetical protein ABG067_003108, partial [Albugo candida]
DSAHEKMKKIGKQPSDVGRNVKECLGEYGEAVRYRVGGLTDKELGRRHAGGGQAGEFWESVSDRVGEYSESARETMSDYAEENAMNRAEELEEITNEKLGNLSEHNHEQLDEWSARARARTKDAREWTNDARERTKETADHAQGRVKDTVYGKMNAAKVAEFRCVSLPMGYKACTHHAAWIVHLLAFAIAIFLHRRRNPKKWKAAVKNMKKKERTLEGMMKESKDATLHSVQRADQDLKLL